MVSDNTLVKSAEPSLGAALQRRQSHSTATMDPFDRRESTSRLRSAHQRQTSDDHLPYVFQPFSFGTTIAESLPPSITVSRDGSHSPELVPFEYDSDEITSDASPTWSPTSSPPSSPGGSSNGKRKIRPPSFSQQFKTLLSHPNGPQLLKLLLGLACFFFVLSVHSVHYRPAVLDSVSFMKSSSRAAIDGFAPSPLLIWCIQTKEKLGTVGAAQSRTWIADARKHGVHVVFASTEDTMSNHWSIYNLPPSLELPQFPYKDIRLTTVNGFRSLFKRKLGEKHRDIRWFMKADDDTYIRIPELLAAIKRAEESGMNPDNVHMIGYPWQDVDAQQWPKTYCWGGPGYMLSRGALQAFGKHSDACYDAMTYEDGIDHTADQAAGLVPSLTFTSKQEPRFGIEYEDMAISRCLDYFDAAHYNGCEEFPEGNKTEFLSLWADNEVHQWSYLRDLNMTADLSVWTKQVEDPPRSWNFQSAVSLHKVPFELMDLVHDVYCTSQGLH